MDTRTPKSSYRESIIPLENRDLSVKKGKEVNLSTFVSEKFHNLTVISDVSINLKSGSATSTEVAVHGKMPFNGVVQLIVSKDEDSDTLVVRVHLRKGSNTCSCNDLSVDVLLPHKALGKTYLTTACGDICIENSIILLGTLNMFTEIGCMECFASCTNVEASSTTGCLDLRMTSHKNIDVKFDTERGNFLGILPNFGHIDLIPPRTTGVVRNRHTNRVGPTAVIRVCSETGDIKIY